jgi:xanthine/uracil permease
MAAGTVSLFAALGDSIPEWARIVIVAGFALVAFNALLVALLWTRERREYEEVQQGSGDWLWPENGDPR